MIDALPLQEAAKKLEFRQYLRLQIQFRGTVGCLVVLAICLPVFFMDLYPELSDGVPAWKACHIHNTTTIVEQFAFDMADHRTLYFVSLLVQICALSTFVIISTVGCFFKLSKAVWWESAFCITMVIFFVMMPFATSDRTSTHISMILQGDSRDPNPVACVWTRSNFFDYADSGRDVFTRLTLYVDVLITAVALYIPLRPIAMFFIILSGLLPALLFNAILIQSIEVWVGPATGLILLGVAAFRGACDQNVLRWQTWNAHQELRETSTMFIAMKRVATSFCDCVITLTSDFRLPSNEDTKLRTFFGADWGRRPLTDFLSLLDATRFNELAAQTRLSNVPGCISLTLRSLDTHSPMEVNVMLVLATGDSYLLGICQTSEQVPPIVEDVELQLQPQPTRLGHDGDALTSTTSQTSDSSHIFTGIDNIAQIYVTGMMEHWIVNEDCIDIDFDNVLGQGGFGCVYAGTLCGSPVAIKCPRIDTTVEQLRRHSVAAINEVRVLRHVRHPHIALFHGVWFCSGLLRLVFEKVSGQSLLSFARGRELATDWQRRILFDISSALWYLHTRRPAIVHGDLKPQNTMVEIRVEKGDSNCFPFAKLIDFGLSRVLSPHAKPLGGTRSYQAPEVAVRGRPVLASDVYSFGCVAFFVGSGSEPKDRLWLQRATKWKQIYEPCVSIDVEERPSMSKIHSEIANIPSQEMLMTL